MKSHAAKRILSLLISLAMLAAPLTVSAAETVGATEATAPVVSEAVEDAAEPGDLFPLIVDEPSEDPVDETISQKEATLDEAGEVFLTLDDFPQFERTADLDSLGSMRQYDDLTDSVGQVPAKDVLGLEKDLPELIEKDESLDAISRKTAASNAYQVGQTIAIRQNPNLYGGGYQAKVVHVGAYCNVLVDTRYSQFDTEAAAIAATFEQDVYSKVTDTVGSPKYTGYGYTNLIDMTGAKTNLVLTNLGSNTLGYVNAGDFYVLKENANDGGYLYSNEGAFLYLDVANIGADWYANDKIRFYSTLAHEFQHVINNSYYFYYAKALIASGTDEEADRRATWLNEGLSGLTESLYMGKAEIGYLQSLVKNDFPNGTGYIPTYEQWAGSNSQYGSTAAMMLEFHAMKGDTPMLVNSGYMGYPNSLQQVGKHSGKGSFDAFFTEAALATAVSSNGGEWASATKHNLWSVRNTEAGGNGFAGVTAMNASGNAVNSAGRAYFAQIFLSQPISADGYGVDITIPASPKATYAFVAVDGDGAGATDAEWIAAQKRPVSLQPGVNNWLPVGGGRRFAVVVINYGQAVSGETFSYAESTFANPSAAATATSLDINGTKTGQVVVNLGYSGKLTMAAKATVSSSDASVVKLDKETTAINNDKIGYTALKKGNATLTVKFFDAADKELTAHAQTFAIAVADTTKTTNNDNDKGSGSSGGGGGGGGGSSMQDGASTTTATAAKLLNAAIDVTDAKAAAAAKSAAAEAKKSGKDTAIVRLKNPGKISLSALKGMEAAAGMPVKLYADSLSPDGKRVDVRVVLDPSKSTKALNLYGSITSAKTQSATSRFAKWYANKFVAVELFQTGDFGMEVEVIIKLPAGMSADDIRVYAFDRATNTFTAVRIANPWLDKNGYIHFKTATAGEFIVSAGALIRK